MARKKQYVVGYDVDPGGKFGYSLEVENTGNVTLEENVVLAFSVDTGSKGAIGTPTASVGDATVTGDTVVWDGSLTAGTTLTITGDYTTDASAPDGQVITSVVNPIDGWSFSEDSELTATMKVSVAPVRTIKITNAFVEN